MKLVLNHIKMIDISKKEPMLREAVAYGKIRLRKETIQLIRHGKIEKGNPLRLAEVAGILATKTTPILLPLCHPIPITHVNVECKIADEEHVECFANVKAIAQTGVEMEALTAVSVALLNIWDAVKKYEKDNKGQYPWTRIEEIRVISKTKITIDRNE